MSTLVIVIVVAIGVVGVRLVIRKRSGQGPVGTGRSNGGSSRVRSAGGADGGVPANKRETYEIGMHPGEDGVPVMFTLATCRHCVHLKDFLTAHGITHHVVFVDDFNGQARTDMMAHLRTFNPRGSFPTLVLPGGKTVVGFREAQVREACGLPEQD